MASSSGSNIDDVRNRQWPSDWPDIQYILSWAAQTHLGKANHTWSPLRESDRDLVTASFPTMRVVEHSAFMILLKSTTVADNVRRHTRYHCTSARVACAVLGAPAPYANKLLVGFSTNQSKAGIHCTDEAAGALRYGHGSKSMGGLCSLLILRSDGPGSKLTENSPNCVWASQFMDHDVVGMIVFKKLSRPRSTIYPGVSTHGLVHVGSDILSTCPQGYKGHCYEVFGCNNLGIAQQLPTWRTDVFESLGDDTRESSDEDTPSVPPATNSVGEFRGLLSDVGTVELPQPKSRVLPPVPLLPTDDFVSGPSSSSSPHPVFQKWGHRQTEFYDLGYLPAPDDSFYCRTGSGKIVLWDFKTNRTVWVPRHLQVSLPLCPREIDGDSVASELCPPNPLLPIGTAPTSESSGVSQCSQSLQLEHPSNEASPSTTLASVVTPGPLPLVPPDTFTPQSFDISSDGGSDSDRDEPSGKVGDIVPPLPADPPKIDWGNITPRFREVINDRLPSLPRPMVAALADRLRESEWTSIVCSNLWSDPVSAQQSVLRLDDPTPIYAFCSELLVACKILCQRLKESRVRQFCQRPVALPAARPSIQPPSVGQSGFGGSSSSTQPPMALPPWSDAGN